MISQVMRGRNRCAHRDYQNIAVNGARAGAMNDTIVASMSRHHELDRPALVVYALIGNDVCNGHIDTVADVRPPRAPPPLSPYPSLCPGAFVASIFRVTAVARQVPRVLAHL